MDETPFLHDCVSLLMNRSMSCLLTFPCFRLDSAFIKHFCFDFCQEEIGESNRHFRSHGRSVNLIVFSAELERIFFKYKAEYFFTHFFKVVGRDRRTGKIPPLNVRQIGDFMDVSTCKISHKMLPTSVHYSLSMVVVYCTRKYRLLTAGTALR